MLSGAQKKRREQDFTWRNMLRSIDWSSGTFHQDEAKRCAFLNSENLCDLYKNMGARSLCRTCKLYPRHIEEFENVREVSLSVSCPEVARILMERREPVSFLTYEKEGNEVYEDFDPFLFSILSDARRAMLRILQDRTLTLKERIMLVLGMAHDMQVRINHQELFACEEAIVKYEKAKALEYVRSHLAEYKLADVKVLHEELFQKLHDLELTRIVSLQMGPQIRMLQNNDTLMTEKIQTSLVNTIPLWKSQMVIALGVEHSTQAAEAQREVADMTNLLLKKNAEKLKLATVETARESERGVVEIETLKATNQALIETFDEVMKILDRIFSNI